MNSSLEEDKLELCPTGFTFTDYLNKSKNDEMKILEQFRYKFPQITSKK